MKGEVNYFLVRFVNDYSGAYNLYKGRTAMRPGLLRRAKPLYIGLLCYQVSHRIVPH